VLSFVCNVIVGLLALGVKGFLVASIVAGWLSAAVLLPAPLPLSRQKVSFRRDLFPRGVHSAPDAHNRPALGALVLRSNVFLLKSYSGGTEVGCFSISAQVADVLGILPGAAALVLFPGLIRSSQDRWASTIRSAVTVAGVTAAVCLVAAALAVPF